MKTKIIYTMLAAASMLSVVSCEKFLDMPETEEQTFEKIWQQRNTTEKYLTHVYSYIYDASNPTQAIEVGAADESSCSWSTSNFAFSHLNKGSRSEERRVGKEC